MTNIYVSETIYQLSIIHKSLVNNLRGYFIIYDFFFFFYNLANRIKCPRVMKLGQIFPVSLYVYLAIWMIKLSYTKIKRIDSGSPRLLGLRLHKWLGVFIVLGSIVETIGGTKLYLTIIASNQPGFMGKRGAHSLSQLKYSNMEPFWWDLVTLITIHEKWCLVTLKRVFLSNFSLWQHICIKYCTILEDSVVCQWTQCNS